MSRIIHPNIIPVNGIKFQVVCPRVLTDEQARNAVFLFLKTHKLRKKPSKKAVVQLLIDNEFLLDVAQGEGANCDVF